MITFIMALHIALCFFLILVVLLQTGKGADMGAAFGGASQTVFGATGAVSLLGKVTSVTAVLFMLTSMTLAWNSSREQSGGGGLDMDQFDKERDAADKPTEPAADEGSDGAGGAAAPATVPGLGDYKDAYEEEPGAGDEPAAGGAEEGGDEAE